VGIHFALPSPPWRTQLSAAIRALRQLPPATGGPLVDALRDELGPTHAIWFR